MYQPKGTKRAGGHRYMYMLGNPTLHDETVRGKDRGVSITIDRLRQSIKMNVARILLANSKSKGRKDCGLRPLCTFVLASPILPKEKF